VDEPRDVALNGMRITGEWVQDDHQRLSRGLPRGTDVEAAATRNQLLLKHPDGSVITARIVQRVKQPNRPGRQRD
jgi:hypothetical protein